MDVDLIKSENSPKFDYGGGAYDLKCRESLSLLFKHCKVSCSANLPSDTKASAAEDHSDRDDRSGTETGILTKPESKTKKPNLYKVLLLNDDYTPMEFVVHVLQRFFRMSVDEATQVMLHVHQKGVGICGVFTYEIAETKVNQVLQFAQQHEHPLQCTLEKE